MPFFLTTKNGYGFFECLSAFQKAVRRGEEETALYFMVELFNSGYDETLWKRIMIITSEDVGIAEPTMPAQIQALYVNYVAGKKDAKDVRPERIFLIHAVVMLCMAKKSRYNDYLLLKLWREHDEVKMKIPEYAYDKHTVKGKSLGRGLEHFFKESAHCENFHPHPNEQNAKEQAAKQLKAKPDKLNFREIQKGNLKQKEMFFEPTDSEE